MGQTPRDLGPQVRVEPGGYRPGPRAGIWLVAWRVHNAGAHPLQLWAARLPHSHFRAEERSLSPPPTVLPGQDLLLELPVKCTQPPGRVVKNAFLILRVLWNDEPWRVLARLRVKVDQGGGPANICELITSQPIGFSLSGR